jgi:RNA polymerase sigma-70 factor (ECF subfamily)
MRYRYRSVEGRPLEDEEPRLVAAAVAGDAGAYESLVRRYSDVAFRTAYLITGSAADAEEAAQEAFFKAHRALSRFRAGAPFRPWILRIVANEARNRRRSEARRTTMALRLIERGGSGDAAPSPEAEAEAAEERRSLLRALNELRDEDRQVIACRFFLDLSVEETADVLACAEGTVKSRLSRALGRLKEAYVG